MKFRVEVEPTPSLVPAVVYSVVIYNDEAKKGFDKLWCGFYDKKEDAEQVQCQLKEVFAIKTNPHKADKWIEDQWMGKQVQQTSGSPDCLGRKGTVVETTWDEVGALHCRMTNKGGEWWCPALFLTVE